MVRFGDPPGADRGTRVLRRVGLVLALATTTGCARAPACGPGFGPPTTLATLYFGRGLADGGEVDAAAWRRFLATIVTPAFPDGLTVTEATGQWRDPATKRIATERSYIVTIATPDAPDLGQRLDRVRAAYRLAFHQQSVGLTVAPVCASF